MDIELYALQRLVCFCLGKDIHPNLVLKTNLALAKSFVLEMPVIIRFINLVSITKTETSPPVLSRLSPRNMNL